jgi:hypothetical protein
MKTETYVLYEHHSDDYDPYPVGEFATVDEARKEMNRVIATRIAEFTSELLKCFTIDKITENEEEQTVDSVF